MRGLQVYSRCKASVIEFQDLSKTIIALHFVLVSIGDFWQEQQRLGQDLSETDKQSLRMLTEPCNEILENTTRLLHKHENLGVGASWRDRMKWASKTIAPIRESIMHRVTLLSALNSIIT